MGDRRIHWSFQRQGTVVARDSWKCRRSKLANEEYSEDNNDLKEAKRKFKEAKTKVASHKEALQIMRKTRGHAETSLYTRVQDVLKTYGISRESYHGGQLDGNACRILV
jgi:uncharacterized protein YgiM (DUF1202 family)